MSLHNLKRMYFLKPLKIFVPEKKGDLPKNTYYNKARLNLIYLSLSRESVFPPFPHHTPSWDMEKFWKNINLLSIRKS